MGSSRPCINISLLLIIASTAILASSAPIQPGMTYDFPTCFESVKGCFDQILRFKFALLTGGQPDGGLICPACCQAIVDIHEKCWLFLLPDPFFTPALQDYCSRSQTAPSPVDPDTPLAPVAPPDPPAPAQSPVDPPAPAQSPVDPPAPAQSPVDPPAPAPQTPAPAPAPQTPAPAQSPIDPPAPAPQTPAPAPAPQTPAPAQSPVDPPAPAPSRCRRHRHRHHGGGGGGMEEKWFCT